MHGTFIKLAMVGAAYVAVVGLTLVITATLSADF
jgi:hypothetical protein